MSTRTLLPLIAAGCVACRGERVDGPQSTELVVVAGGSATDTAGARLAQALVVEVRENGRPVAGVVVKFAGTPVPNPSPRWADERTAWTSDVTVDYLGATAQITTNASGRAVAMVQLGARAGEAAIVVTCPALSLTDTARYTVLPGNPFRLVMTADTAVLAGVTYPLDAYVSDRSGNRRENPVTYSAGPNVVSVDAAGRVTVSSQISRGAVALRSGALLDSARFTVVPDGAIAYLDFTDVSTSAADGVITTSRMDGTRRETWGKARSPAFPTLSPTDSLVAYERRDDLGRWSIILVDRSGVSRALYDDPLRSARHPRFSRDGKFVYFSGNAYSAPKSIWRVRTDGTDPVRLVETADSYAEPPFAVTPDEQYIAYVGGRAIVIRELSTGRETAFGDYAYAMEFSPDGQRLAYTGPGGITIVNLDGSTPVTIGGGWLDTATSLTWTADGQWLLVHDGTGVVLVRPTSGETVRLPGPLRFQLTTRR